MRVIIASTLAGVMSVGAAGPVRAIEPPTEPAPQPAEAPAVPTADKEPAELPPFTAEPPEGWKIIQTTAKRLVLARADSPFPVPDDQPMVVITKSSKVFKEETARRQSVIQFGDDLKRWTFKGQPKVEKFSANGRSGYECIRKGVRTHDDAGQRVYVGKLFLDDGNIVVMGYGPDDEKADALLETFKAITRSVKPKSP